MTFGRCIIALVIVQMLIGTHHKRACVHVNIYIFAVCVYDIHIFPLKLKPRKMNERNTSISQLLNAKLTVEN